MPPCFLCFWSPGLEETVWNGRHWCPQAGLLASADKAYELVVGATGAFTVKGSVTGYGGIGSSLKVLKHEFQPTPRW